MTRPLRVLVAGCGNMGASHARAYHRMPEFEIAGLVSRGPASRAALSKELGGLPEFADFYHALDATRPDVVSVNTYPETHGAYARAAIEAGCHVFCEKPLAETVAEAQSIVDAARAGNRKLVIGYILRVHPAWVRFIEIARTLGKPLVMRMNLNQQSHGQNWNWHRNLMDSMSPIVDCGVHYVDVMCQMTQARPVRVSGIGARLTDELKPGMYNYGHLQVTFDDGSVGWYEAGWGPMMSEVAFFVKDVVGPKGCVSIVKDPNEATAAGSDDIDSHTKTNCIRLHHSALDANNEFVRPDEFINTEDEPDHQALCDREQAYLLKAIQEDLDLSAHMHDAVNSLRIVLAAEESFRTGQTVDL
jgi:predicted dehydrogenase